MEPRVIEGAALEDLRAAVQNFLIGTAQPYAEFAVADFRDHDHNVLAVVEQSC